MPTYTTVCARDCYDTCSIRVTLDDDGRIVSLKGDPEHPITQGFLCPRGVKDHDRLSANRIQRPMIRRKGQWMSTTWETVLDLVASRLQDTLAASGPDSVLYLDYAGNMGLLTTGFPQRLWNLIGATRTDYALCSKSGHTGIARHYGESYGLPLEAIPSQALLVFWGFNAAVSAPHIWKLARQARQRSDAKIVVIDPVRTATAKQADLWLQPRPGTDVALAYGLIHAIQQRGGADEAFAQNWIMGFEALQQAAAQWPAERLGPFTSIPSDTIQQLANLYATHTPSCTLIGIGLQKCDNGADQARAVSLIPAVLGLHRGFFYSNGAATWFDDDELCGKSLASPQQRRVSQVGLAEAMQRGEFKFVYVNCMNPALTLPNQHALREGLSRDDVCVVVHDTHWTRTTDFADVALPAPTYLEKEDIVLPWAHQYVRYAPQVVQPVTDSRDEVQVMHGLAARLGLHHTPVFEDPWNALQQAFDGMLEDGGREELLSGELLKFKTKPADRYTTPSGKIECADLPTQPELPDDDGAFTLLNSSTAQYTSTQFQSVYGSIPALVHIHPQDAARRGIEDGQSVYIRNEQGRMRVSVSISEQVSPGVLWSPRQAEDVARNPQNGLTQSRPQAIGNGPRFNSTRVFIVKE